MDQFSGSFRESLTVGNLPRLDRFFPSCGLGLVELTARGRFGAKDIKPCWFATGFHYTRPEVGLAVPQNSGELPVHIGVGAGPGRRAWTLLESLYGISVEKLALSTFEAFASWITESLRNDMPALVLMDQNFLPGRAGWDGPYSPHMVAVTGVDTQKNALLVSEQVLGKVEWSADGVISSFERVSRNAENFALSCRQIGAISSRLVEPEDVAGHLDECLANRYSAETGIGLNGLRQFVSDVRHAYEACRSPFSVPGMWIFSHDRHALRRSLSYWELALPNQRALLKRLDAVLASCFEEWFAVDMCIESSTRGGADKMAEGVERLSRTVELEERLTLILAELRQAL